VSIKPEQAHLVDLTSSISFTVQRARSDLVRVEEGDVISVGKIASDSLWHRVDAYVGVTLPCRRCSSDFSFAAAEQKAWREDYGFSIHSYPIHCRECRVVEREITSLRKQLDAVLSLATYTSKDIESLIDLAIQLIQKGRRDLIGPRLKQKIFWAAKRSLHPSAAELVRTIK
jgi:hypothetical protein